MPKNVKLSSVYFNIYTMMVYGKVDMQRATQPQNLLEVSGQLHASAALTIGKEHEVTTEQLAGWDQGLFWMYWQKEITLLLQETEPGYFSHPVCILVPSPTDNLFLLTVSKENGNLFQIRTAHSLSTVLTLPGYSYI
jgi:hypothetical protein